MTKAIRWSPEQLAEFQKKRAGQGNAAPIVKPVPPAPVKVPKFRNQKVEQDGGKFDSKREARRYTELLQMQAMEEITDLRRQVKYELIPKQTRADGAAERACSYLADFTYMRGGLLVVEDAKGMRTSDYVIKRKLMLFIHGITIIEV